MSAAATLPGLDTPPWSLEPQRAVVGIDPSTLRMSAAVLLPVAARRFAALGQGRGDATEHRGTDAAFEVSTLSLPRAPAPMTATGEARRLAESQGLIVGWAGELLTTWDPVLVVVETPFAHGRLVPVESFHVIGILLAVLGQFGVRVERMGPSSWKRAALGPGGGGAKKPPFKCGRGGSHRWPMAERWGDGACERCAHEPYRVLAWARAAGYDGALWDEADAIGLATAGGVLLDREQRAA